MSIAIGAATQFPKCRWGTRIAKNLGYFAFFEALPHVRAPRREAKRIRYIRYTTPPPKCNECNECNACRFGGTNDLDNPHKLRRRRSAFHPKPRSDGGSAFPG